MFGHSINQLPSCVDYAGAVRVYERSPTPRSKKWDPWERPLKDVKATHYAVIKDGDTVVFRLHSTNVVEWHGPTSLTLDSSYDSIMTRQFADRFLPAGIGFTSMKEEGYVVALHDQRFLRGRHAFECRDGRWEVVSATTKPRRTVLDKDQAALVNAKLTDFLDWIRSIWAVAGNDGSHPWVDAAATHPRGLRYALDTLGPDNYPEYVAEFIPRSSTWAHGVGMKYALTRVQADVLTRTIREHFYKQENCYIRIDYDAPVPRRTK